MISTKTQHEKLLKSTTYGKGKINRTRFESSSFNQPFPLLSDTSHLKKQVQNRLNSPLAGGGESTLPNAVRQIEGQDDVWAEIPAHPPIFLSYIWNKVSTGGKEYKTIGCVVRGKTDPADPGDIWGLPIR